MTREWTRKRPKIGLSISGQTRKSSTSGPGLAPRACVPAPSPPVLSVLLVSVQVSTLVSALSSARTVRSRLSISAFGAESSAGDLSEISRGSARTETTSKAVSRQSDQERVGDGDGSHLATRPVDRTHRPSFLRPLSPCCPTYHPYINSTFSSSSPSSPSSPSSHYGPPVAARTSRPGRSSRKTPVVQRCRLPSPLPCITLLLWGTHHLSGWLIWVQMSRQSAST